MESLEENVKRLVIKLIHIPSISGSVCESQAMSFICNWLSGISNAHVITDSELKAIICLPNSMLGKQRMVNLLSGHIDTVPVGSSEQWHTDPFDPVVRNGKLYGRGSSDMKGGLAAELVAFSQLCKANSPCAIAITTGEEIGCKGAVLVAKLLRKYKIRLKGVIIGEATNNITYPGHRGVLWLQIVSEGISVHAATPQYGVNAILLMLKALELFKELPLRRHPLLGLETINIGTISGGVAPNIVPDTCSVLVDIRLVDREINHFISYFKSTNYISKIFTELYLQPVWTPIDNPWLLSIPGEHSNDPVPYYTDGSVYHQYFPDVPIAICGPGDLEAVHRPDESVELQKIVEAARIYLDFLNE